MSKFMRNDNSLYNGISQQAVELRLPNQVADAVNTKLTVSYGLEKRPPAEPIVRIEDTYTMDALVHTIDRDQSEQYVMVWGNTAGRDKVWDLEGVEYPVIEDTADTTYIRTPDPTTGSFIPSLHLKLTTVLDNTILVNTNAVTSTTTAGLGSIPNDVYVHVNNGVTQVQRVLTIDDTLTLTAPKGSLNDTEVIVDAFISAMAGELDYIATKISKSVMLIQRVDTTLPKVVATDTYGDSTMDVFNSTGSLFEDLPPKALDDAVVRVTAEDATSSVYYLKFDEQSDAWFETFNPEESEGINSIGMPKTVVRRQDDGGGSVTGTPNQIYFSVEDIEWNSRVSGGVDEAPNPSFIGSTINDVFFYKNRLGFLSGENVILSKTDDLFNFWPASVKEVFDDDPVDISVSSNKALTLTQVATFPDSLILFGTTKQFSLHSDGKPFTALNITVDPTTAYITNQEADPVSVGSSLYFSAPLGRYSQLREYAVAPDTLVSDATDVTGHVPRFLPTEIKQLIAEPNLEYVFLVDKEDRDEDCCNTLWVYKFFWQGNEKVQSAWMKWKLWANPIGGGVFNGELYLLCQELRDNTTKTILVKFNLESQPEELLRAGTDIPFKVTQPLIDSQQLVEEGLVTFTDVGVNIEVSLEVYNTFGQECPLGKLVDRWTGEEYVYDSKFIVGGNTYYLTFLGVSSGDNTPTTYDPRILGTYTTGTDDIDTGA